jgi:hypothetical protein
LSDESTPAQQRRSFYGILDWSSSGGAAPGSTGRDWNDVCTVHVAESGAVTITGA